MAYRTISEHRFDLDHAVLGVAPADVAALLVILWPALLTLALDQRIPAR
jgi:hypothetical protein